MQVAAILSAQSTACVLRWRSVSGTHDGIIV